VLVLKTPVACDGHLAGVCEESIVIDCASIHERAGVRIGGSGCVVKCTVVVQSVRIVEGGSRHVVECAGVAQYVLIVERRQTTYC